MAKAKGNAVIAYTRTADEPLLKTGMPADVLKSVAIYYNIRDFNVIYQSGGVI